MRLLPLLIVAFTAVAQQAICQDSTSLFNKTTHFPVKFIDKVNAKAERLEAKVIAGSQKYLRRLAKREARLKRKLYKLDSSAAASLFANSQHEYERLSNELSTATGNRGAYTPFVDSVKVSLSFLQQQSGLNLSNGKIKKSLEQVQQLQARLQNAEQAKQFVRQRRQQLKEALSKYTNLPKSISKDFERYNKEVYYYSQQIKEYKEILNDPEKLERKALDVLSRLPAFQQFMQQHSELASIFRMPGNAGSAQSMAGLQTRVQVQQLIQTQFSGGGLSAQQVVQQSVQQAQQQLSQLKDKLAKLGGGSSDMEMPDFKPNSQRTKSFWKRLEYGTNLQSVKSNFFPTTTDIGLSVGYRLNDKAVIGIGGSYKVGWGKDIHHIDITQQGASLRSFFDIKLKGSFYASGGYEHNYQPVTITSSAGLVQNEAWQQSGLVGISKIVSLKSKLFKKTKLQLLWDFLSYQQVPRTQAIKFRVGYNF